MHALASPDQVPVLEPEGSPLDRDISIQSLHAVFAAMPDPVVIADEKRVIAAVNPAMLKVFGYDEHEVIGRAKLMLYADPDEDDRQIKSFAEAGLEASDRTLADFRRKDGSVFQGRITAGKFGDLDGQCSGYFGIIQDITDFLHPKQCRQDADDVLQLALEANPDGFVVFDEEDRLVACNSAYKALYEKSKPAIRPGATFESILRYGLERGQYPTAGDTLESREAWLAERLRQHRDQEAPLIQKIGPRRWLRIEERVTSNSFRVGTRTDISSIKLAEEKLAAINSELETRTMALEEFAAVVSHDLQAPLRHMTIFAKMLLEMEDLPAAGSGHVDQIARSADRMRALIRSLLDYCKLAYQQVKREKVRFSGIVSAASEPLDWQIAEKGALITVNDDPVLSCDPELLTRVIQNILENALRFSNGEKPVIAIDISRGPLDWVISVSDAGPGVAAKHADRVFQMFRQVGEDCSQREGGGVGLALCKRIVESHGGRIWLDTAYTEGCCIRFTLPAE